MARSFAENTFLGPQIAQKNALYDAREDAPDPRSRRGERAPPRARSDAGAAGADNAVLVSRRDRLTLLQALEVYRTRTLSPPAAALFDVNLIRTV